MSKERGVKWTRKDYLIALNLYCKLPFGQFDAKNRIIMDVAERMGRTPGSLAMKLSNLASLDPVQQARGVAGLAHGATKDRDMWNEFHADIATLGAESEQMLHGLFTQDEEQELDFLNREKVRLEIPPGFIAPSGPTESEGKARFRRGQQFFRQAVLNAYGVRCCISGINVPRLLIASHVKPWRDFPQERLNPRNGLCLSSIHDAAFDGGLITLDKDLNVVLSSRLRRYFPQRVLEQNFVPFEGRPIRLPDKLAEPDPEFISFHRTEIFAG
jgi:hypothetical protein